ncbi:DUF4440 domain-containing protein [Paludisphaera rhizosphaerae]|uniref:DUF4440 domain-containing protein n=1 Tax=Paludisphaera rhizosphaerae TaxID=2711216 RepID=UPI0013EE2E9A|nr:DUF4440 domain-containing protein [Paludisphaera rhizosphaerae]
MGTTSTRSPMAAALALLAIAAGTARGQDLERLKYNNPGLVVDLGVGLWAWPLPMDFDGDGDLDLVVNCPDKPSNGVYFFENTAGPTSRTKLPVFKPGRRISKGLQNVQVSYVDGRPRILSPGAEHPDFLKTGLEKSKKLTLPANVHPNKVRGNFWRYVDYDGDGKLDVVVGADDWTDYGWDNAYNADGVWTRGPLRGYVYVAKNVGDNDKPKYETPSRLTVKGDPLEVFGWPSPNFADFDGDGDLDLLCGEFLDGFTYFENIGSRTEPKYSPGRRLKRGDGSPLTMDLEMITPTAIDWDLDGDLDLIVGDEDGRVALVENAGGLADDRTPRFLAPVYFQQEADDLKFGALATPFGFDWDGDGDFDVVSGDTAGYIGFFENLSGPGVARPKWAAPKLLEADGSVIRIMAGPNGSIQGPCEAKWGYTTLSIADWDGDGLPDLLVNSILGKVHWYKNVGTRNAPKLAAAQPIEVAWTAAQPQPELAWGWMKPVGNELLTQWRTTPVAVDWNRDGLVDLVMLDQEGYLAFFEREKRDGKLSLRPPARVFVDEAGEPLRLNSKAAGGSGRRKLCVVDWDRDGKLDLLLNAANALFYKQVPSTTRSWTFRNVGLLSNTNIEGHDVSPTVVDFDADGVPDFLGGAEDGRLYFLRNPASGGQAATPAVEHDPAGDVREVLAKQVSAWNAGDLDGFLTTYWDSPELVFQSGGTKTMGFGPTRDRYRSRYKAEGRAMGRLDFTDVEVDTLGPDSAMARGGWHLVMPDGAEPHGLFTLILRRLPAGWKIVHDHTSAADPAPAKKP